MCLVINVPRLFIPSQQQCLHRISVLHRNLYCWYHRLISLFLETAIFPGVPGLVEFNVPLDTV